MMTIRSPADGSCAMSSFGSYEVVEELHRTPFGYVYSARRANSNGNSHQTEYVIKVYEAPDTDGDGLPGPVENGSDRFVGRARVQQKVSQAQVRHWARIHELGEAGEQPYYITDYYPRSAQKLILGRVILGPAALHEIVRSIVDGLRELRQVCNQSHGSLKPTNVLIGGAGEVSGAKIVLTDPACGGPPGETEQGGDLQALGALVYQLVLHRPFHHTAWPVQDSEEWASLGKLADGWRELCNGLLNPDPTKRPEPATLDRSLAALALHGISVKQIANLPTAAARKVPVKSIAVGLTLLLLLAGGGGAFLYFKQAAAYARVRQERAAWVDALWNDKKSVNQIASVGGPVIQESDWEMLQLPDRPRSYADFSLAALRRSQGAQSTLDQVHQRLRDAYDKSAAPLRDLQNSFSHDGYAQAAGYLGSILSAPLPDDAHLAGAINGRMALAAKLKASPPGMTPATASALEQLGKSGDRDLRGFASAIRAAYRGQCALTSDGWSGARALDKLAQQILSVENWPTDYDADRLGREQKLDSDRLQVPDIQRWLAVVDQYRWQEPTESQRAAGQKLASQLNSTAKQIRDGLVKYLAADSPQVQKLEEECGAIQKQIDQLSSARFIARDLPAAIDGPAAKLSDRISTLPSRYTYQPNDLATWFAQAQSQSFKSPAAEDAWKKWMKSRTAENVDITWKAQTVALAGTLTDLETRTFVVPGALEGEPWATQARSAADEAVARAIGQIPAGATELPPDKLNAVRNDFATWCDQVTKLKEEHQRLQHVMIDAAVLDHHDKQWSSESDRTFWATQVEAGPFAEIMKPQIERMEAIRAIVDEPSAPKVIETASSSSRPEVILAVWSRLGTLQKREFPGPMTAAGVEAWTDLLEKVETASRKLPPMPWTAIQKQVAASGRGMWLDAMKSADSPELLEAAGAAGVRLHLNPETARLSDLQRFNLALADATRTSNSETSSALAARLANLPEWDRSALEEPAAGSDIVQTTIKNRSYLWPAGEADRKQKWQNRHTDPVAQLSRAKALMEDYQPQAARAAVEGLSGPDVEDLRKRIEENEQAAPGLLRQGNSSFLNHNYGLAFQQLKQAAQGGSAEAMLRVGHMYRTGTGVLRDRNRELKFYRLAAAAGNVEAMGELAVTYFSFPQWPVDANAPEVARWFKTAADAGNVDAMAALAQIAIQKHDLDQAAKWLSDADAKDSGKKEWHLGSLMRQLADLYEAKRDPDEARKWLQSAADRGDTKAQELLRR